MEVKRREDLLRIKEEYLDRQKSYKRQVLVYCEKLYKEMAGTTLPVTPAKKPLYDFFRLF